MSLANDVAGGAVVVTGVWAAWQHLTQLVIDNAKPEMTRSERADHWQLLAQHMVCAQPHAAYDTDSHCVRSAAT